MAMYANFAFLLTFFITYSKVIPDSDQYTYTVELNSEILYFDSDGLGGNVAIVVALNGKLPFMSSFMKQGPETVPECLTLSRAGWGLQRMQAIKIKSYSMG